MIQISLGIAGTAKNTGKTTTTAAILQELRMRDIPLFITSIGYDGENLDNITGLPKPKLWVEPGDIIATAAQCFKISTASFRMLEETEVCTPLGKVWIAEVKKPGLAVAAGPNKSSDVKIVAALLRRIGPGVILFDGALNRLAPIAETDGFILATGAAKTPDIVQLARETGLIWQICNLPAIPQASDILGGQFRKVVVLGPDLRVIKKGSLSSLFTDTDVTDLLQELPPEGSYLYIPGIMSAKAVKALRGIFQRSPRRMYLTFNNPTKLLLMGDLVATKDLIRDLFEFGVIVGVGRRVPLLGITVNPFFPEYRVESKNYRPAFVDARLLQSLIKRQVPVPVYDVVRCGAQGLVDTILLHRDWWQRPDTMTL